MMLSQQDMKSTFDKTDGKCCICGRSGGNVKLDIHHIIFKSQSGSDHPDNLVFI